MSLKAPLLLALLALAACGNPDPKPGSTASSNGSNSSTNSSTSGTNNATTPTNVVAGDLLYAVLIQSTTSAPDACFTGDPGPDLFGVALETAEGETIAWGETLWDEIQAEGNMYADVSLLDGQPKDFAAGLCPDDFTDSVVSLGCDGGFLAVRFIDADGQPVGVPANDESLVVRVYEWGDQCTLGTISDTYNVSLCRDTEGVGMGDISSCDISLIIDGSAEQTTTLLWF